MHKFVRDFEQILLSPPSLGQIAALLVWVRIVSSVGVVRSDSASTCLIPL